MKRRTFDIIIWSIAALLVLFMLAGAVFFSSTREETFLWIHKHSVLRIYGQIFFSFRNVIALAVFLVAMICSLRYLFFCANKEAYRTVLYRLMLIFSAVGMALAGFILALSVPVYGDGLSLFLAYMAGIVWIFLYAFPVLALILGIAVCALILCIARAVRRVKQKNAGASAAGMEAVK